MNKLFCSTGTLVGKANGYNYSFIEKSLPLLYQDGIIDGAEFMMIPYYYEILDKVCRAMRESGVPSPIIHCEKDVGVLLSNCTSESTKRALELLKTNCETGCKINASSMVFHLWGGVKSDYHIEYNISMMSKILEIVSSFGLNLLIENIPCTTYSGLENWRRLYSYLPQIGFVFDCRFGAFHDEINEILTEPIWDHIKHLHISDYSSYPRDFSKIRPILHPGEGVIDFDELFNGIKANKFSGTITLESPVMTPEGIDFEKLKKSLIYVKNNI